MSGLTPSKDAPQQTSEHEDVINDEKAERKEKKPEAVPKQKGKKDKPKTKVMYSIGKVYGKVPTHLCMERVNLNAMIMILRIMYSEH